MDQPPLPLSWRPSGKLNPGKETVGWTGRWVRMKAWNVQGCIFLVMLRPWTLGLRVTLIASLKALWGCAW